MVFGVLCSFHPVHPHHVYFQVQAVFFGYHTSVFRTVCFEWVLAEMYYSWYSSIFIPITVVSHKIKQHWTAKGSEQCVELLVYCHQMLVYCHKLLKPLYSFVLSVFSAACWIAKISPSSYHVLYCSMEVTGQI